MRGTHRVLRVELDLDMQPVIAKQQGLWFLCRTNKANELCRVSQASDDTVLQFHGQPAVAGIRAQLIFVGVTMRPGCEWRASIEKIGGIVYNPLASYGVVACPWLRAPSCGNHIGSVQGVVQTAPACVGRIQRVPRVIHRHYQLWASELRNFRIDAFGGNPDWTLFRQQITNLEQKRLLFVVIDGLSAPHSQPRVDSGLALIALRQQFSITRAEIVDDFGQAGPELFGGDPGAGRDFVTNEFGEAGCDLEPGIRYVGRNFSVVADGRHAP